MARPKFVPSEEQRRLVASLAAFGISHKDIGVRIGLRSPKTLRRHFRQELDHAAIEANARVARIVYQMAISGKSIVAAIFWLKCRAHWREAVESPSRLVEVPPFLVEEEKDPA